MSFSRIPTPDRAPRRLAEDPRQALAGLDGAQIAAYSSYMRPEVEEVDRLTRRVEEVVGASRSDWADQWRALRDRIARDLAAVSPQTERDVLEEVLITICNALQYQEQVAARRRRRETYEPQREERQRIERLLEEVSASNVVSRFSYSIEYRDPEQYLCPHGRRRNVCERLHAQLAYCKDPHLRIALRLSPFILKRMEEAIEDLKKHGVDPRTHTLDQLCRPDERAPRDASVPVTRPGAPHDHVAAMLLDTVVGLLVAAGLTIRASCRHLADIRALCFPSLDRQRARSGIATDPEDVAETLEREWRERRKNASADPEIVLRAGAAGEAGKTLA